MKRFFRSITLRRKMALLILLPVGGLLLLTGWLGYFYARSIMLDQWREAAILKLQRAAHHIDMRLGRPLDRIEMLYEASPGRTPPGVRQWLLEGIEGLEGVYAVEVSWEEGESARRGPGPGHSGMGRGPMMDFHHGQIARITAPEYSARAGEEIVTLVSLFKDEADRTVGRLEVMVTFEHLIRDMSDLGWWQSDAVCIIDRSGRILARTSPMEEECTRLGESGDQLQLAVLRELETRDHGTILGQGHPPAQVAGFYKMARAPWALVIFAPGEEILAPIVRFRLYYAVAGALAVLVSLLLIRTVTGRVARSIGEVSRAAGDVAQGSYGRPLPVQADDEIGQLTRSFNAMVQGLKERDLIRNTFGRYMDEGVARELLKRPEATRLGGDKREVAILMSDIRGFTALAETLNPEGTLGILNLYFGHMIEVIKEYKGIIVDFFGDGVLAFFDPIEGPLGSAVDRAVRCAQDMESRMKEINGELGERNLPALETGIGVHAGPVVVGNIGSETRAKYGIVGSPVNLTSRIQAEAGPGEILLSDQAYRAAEPRPPEKKSFEVSVKGIGQPVRVHVLVNTAGPADGPEGAGR